MANNRLILFVIKTIIFLSYFAFYKGPWMCEYGVLSIRQTAEKSEILKKNTALVIIVFNCEFARP